jgi:hypothetical protein
MSRVRLIWLTAVVLGLGSAQAFATHAFICGKGLTERSDHKDAEVSMIGEDTRPPEARLFVHGVESAERARVRWDEKKFTITVKENASCKLTYEFSLYPIPPADLLCSSCGSDSDDQPMVRVTEDCRGADPRVKLERPCFHYED